MQHKSAELKQAGVAKKIKEHKTSDPKKDERPQAGNSPTGGSLEDLTK